MGDLDSAAAVDYAELIVVDHPTVDQLGQMLKPQAELESHSKSDPDAPQEALRLQTAKHANLLIPITFQQLYRLYKKKEKEYITHGR